MWPEDGSALEVSVRVAFGADRGADPGTWTWTELGDRLGARAIRLQAGKRPGSRYASPAQATLTLDNDDGALTPGNSMSPYWPQIQLGTPLQVRVFWGGVWHTRFSGFADSWRPAFTPTTGGATASTVEITAYGPLQRLGAAKGPRSPLRRLIGSPASLAAGLLAYWPLEDSADSVQAASAMAGVSAMKAAGPVEFAEGDVNMSPGGTRRWGTLPLPSLTAGGSLTGQVPAGVSSPVAWSVHLFWQAVGGTDDDLALVGWDTPGGTFARWELVQDRGGVDGTYLVGYSSAGAPTVVWSTITTFVGPADLVVSAVQSGGNISVTFRFGTSTFNTSVAGTLTRITGVSLNPHRVTFADDDRFIVGHLRIWDNATAEPVSVADLRSYRGELAHVRLARLCAEDGIAIDVPAVADGVGTPLGPQPVGTPLELYRECEDADMGVLYETGFGLGYLPRAGRYNPPVDMTVDLAAYRTASGTGGNVLTPTYNNEDLVNELTVSREGGSSVVVSDSVSEAQAGTFPLSVDLNVLSDDQLAGQATWRAHVAGMDVDQ